MTDMGVAVMKGAQKPPGILSNLMPERRARRTRTRVARVTAPASVDETHQHDPETQARFERLRAARAELATEHSLPAYIICNDKTLALIAEQSPTTSEELELIKGMGPHKVRMYGQKLLEALA
jgi:ATP-dependent DNA helicase RecQ